MSDRTPQILDLLRAALNSAAEIANSRLGRALRIVDAEATDSSALLRFDVRFEGDATLSWFVSNEDATGFSDMLIGGTGDRGAVLTEMHLDALSGVFSDMLERAVVGLNSGLARELQAGGVDMGMEGGLPDVEPGALRMIVAYEIDGFGQLTIVEQADPLMVSLLERECKPEGASSDEPASQAAPASDEGTDSQQATPVFGADAPLAGAASDNVVQLPGLAGRGDPVRSSSDLRMLLNVPLQLTVELGRTERTVREILDLSVGSIIELSKLAGDPMDIMVNGKVLARGEVVVIDEEFGIRVTEILSPEQRLRNMG